jgi:hypothetical protein
MEGEKKMRINYSFHYVFTIALENRMVENIFKRCFMAAR